MNRNSYVRSLKEAEQLLKDESIFIGANGNNFIGALIDGDTFVFGWAIEKPKAPYIVSKSNAEAWKRLETLIDKFNESNFESVSYNNWYDMAHAINSGEYIPEYDIVNSGKCKYASKRYTVTDEVLDLVRDGSDELEIAIMDAISNKNPLPDKFKYFQDLVDANIDGIV